jgi:hypothetical protein
MAPVVTEEPLVTDSDSVQSTPSRVRISRVAPTVIGILALITAAFTVGRQSKVSVADVSESTELDGETIAGLVTAFKPTSATKGTATPFTLTLSAEASASGDQMKFAADCSVAGNYVAVTKSAEAKTATATFTVATSETSATLKLCYMTKDKDATAQTPTPATLTVAAAAAAAASSMTLSSFGTSYSQATVGKTYAQIKAIDDIIRFNAADTNADATVKSLKTFYTSASCNSGCKTTVDQAMSQMLSGTMRSR